MRGSFWWLVCLNLFDAWATLRGLAAGALGEANPLFAWLLGFSPSLAGVVKLGIVPLFACLVAAAPVGSWAERALRLLVGVYGVVALVHLIHLAAPA
ncbi:MAG TPA: hypothetical protein GXX28_02295 [Firmicutes bacterium]|nr:hypothetical protein [Bacillota bacterium]